MTHYFTNGGGRDDYIYRNNGGFTSMYDPVNWPQKGTLHTVHKKAPPNPVMHAKPIYYRSDGSGRDSYVVTTAGGQF